MNKTPSEAVALVEELKPLVANEECRCSILCTSNRYSSSN